MKNNFLPKSSIVILVILLIGCSPGSSVDVTPTVEMMEESTTPSVSPTETEFPPTETPIPPGPIEIIVDDVNDEGCVIVKLNTESWGPLYASYNATSDPFYQFHDNEDGFYFNIELYTVYGSGWKGETGTFDTNCRTNGICVYLVPDNTNPFLAASGEIVIDTLAQTDGTLQKPAAFSLNNLTFKPVPGSGSEGCYFVESLSLMVED